MATHSSILAWRIPGREKPSGLPSMGQHRVRHDRSNLAAAAAEYIMRNARLDGAQAGIKIAERNINNLRHASVAPSCPTLCDPMECNMSGFPVHHQLLELSQTHVYRVSDAIQPSYSLSSPPAFNLSQHQGLLYLVSSLHQVDKGLELQLQHQSF